MFRIPFDTIPFLVNPFQILSNWCPQCPLRFHILVWSCCIDLHVFVKYVSKKKKQKNTCYQILRKYYYHFNQLNIVILYAHSRVVIDTTLSSYVEHAKTVFLKFCYFQSCYDHYYDTNRWVFCETYKNRNHSLFIFYKIQNQLILYHSVRSMASLTNYTHYVRTSVNHSCN